MDAITPDQHSIRDVAPDQPGGERFDIVYMWVDDQWPGYMEELRRYALSGHDRNPNRTRDNLDMLKFSLRSIERHAPWRGNTYIVTRRPQCPAWLNRNHPSLRLVHHDEIMPADVLPTFNSFAIQSYVHKIRGLSRRFVSFDDDHLLLNPTTTEDLIGGDGKILYDFDGHLPRSRPAGNSSPWTTTLANNAALLDEIEPTGRHRGFAHGPKMFDTGDCAEIAEHWHTAFERTRRSRFRAHDNVSLEALLPQYLVARGRATAVETNASKRREAYLGLENIDLWNRYWLWRIEQRRVKFLTLNDNFGPRPNPRAVRNVRRWLEASFPTPSAYETARPTEGA